MKKQMIALAVAGALTGAALAADVSVYGLIDTGLVYSGTEFGGNGDAPADTHSFSMKSNVLAGSRFGFKGSENLGNGYSVEFQLENGFDSDTGSLHTSGKIFDREARISLNTPYGQLSFGRMGALTSGAGSYDVFMAAGDSMDGGKGNYIGKGYWFSRARYDNMITYVTPEANGFKGYAQYSFQTSGSEDSSVRNNDRYIGLGLTYSAGPLNVALVADMVQYSNAKNKELSYIEFYDDGSSDGETVSKLPEKYATNHDAKAVSLGVNYDFGVTRAFFGAQYGKNETLDLSVLGGIKTTLVKDNTTDERYMANSMVVDGYNLHLGAKTPLPFGEFSVSVFYGDYEATKDSDLTVKKYGIGVLHTYPLSKRTKIYAGAGYGQMDLRYEDEAEDGTGRIKCYDVVIGLNHKF